VLGQTANCPQCGHLLLVPLPHLAPGTVLGGFQIIRRLAQGGMGEVFLARQTSMDRDVALKILSPSLILDEALIKRFHDEVRTLANLRHPNIVTAFDAGEQNGFYYMAMAYVDGEDLGGLSSRGTVLAEKRMLPIFLRICEALSYAWDEMKLIHHDIKPPNIIIDRKGTPILLDFGLAKPLASGATSDGTGSIAGTPLYISPEALQNGSKPDFRSDMYSLGATMYAVATGVPPFEGKSAVEILQKHLNAPIPDPRGRRKNLSAGFARLVMAMMAKRPGDRYRTWQELIDDFYRVSLGEEPEGPGARRPTQGTGQHHVTLAKRVRWYRVVLAVLIATIILLLGAAGIVISMLL